jgi:hypothetical protein
VRPATFGRGSCARETERTRKRGRESDGESQREEFIVEKYNMGEVAIIDAIGLNEFAVCGEST